MRGSVRDERSAQADQDALQEEAREFGVVLYLDDNDPPEAQQVEEIYLWPCNLPAWNCWHAIQTQWRIGMAGATGLDYPSVLAYLERIEGLSGPDLRERFELMQACERLALTEWAQRRESSK